VPAVAASERRAIVARPDLCELRPPHTVALPDTATRAPSTGAHRWPIGKTAVSDHLSLCSCFIDHHWPPTCGQCTVNRKVYGSNLRLAPSVARQPVCSAIKSAIATLLVYIMIVSGKFARPALPRLVPLHCTCEICRLPYHIFLNSYSSLPSTSQIEKKVQPSHAAPEESSPDRFESVHLSAT
jgi:hypothetical protein